MFDAPETWDQYLALNGQCLNCALLLVHCKPGGVDPGALGAGKHLKQICFYCSQSQSHNEQETTDTKQQGVVD